MNCSGSRCALQQIQWNDIEIDQEHCENGRQNTGFWAALHTILLGFAHQIEAAWQGMVSIEEEVENNANVANIQGQSPDVPNDLTNYYVTLTMNYLDR